MVLLRDFAVAQIRQYPERDALQVAPPDMQVHSPRSV